MRGLWVALQGFVPKLVGMLAARLAQTPPQPSSSHLEAGAQEEGEVQQLPVVAEWAVSQAPTTPSHVVRGLLGMPGSMASQCTPACLPAQVDEGGAVLRMLHALCLHPSVGEALAASPNPPGAMAVLAGAQVWGPAAQVGHGRCSPCGGQGAARAVHAAMLRLQPVPAHSCPALLYEGAGAGDHETCAEPQ